MANKITDTVYYQDIADAIRLKNGSTDTYTPADMGPAIKDIPSGDDTLKQAMAGEFNGVLIIDYGETIYPTPGVQFTLDSSMNAGVTKIKYICKEGTQEQNKNPINTYSNRAGYALEEIDFGNLEATWFGLGSIELGSWANLTKVTGEKLKRVNNMWGNFLQGSSIVEANFPLLEQIPSGGFSACTKLKTVNLPKATSFGGGSSFLGCTSLKTVNLPLLGEIGSNSFQRCTALEEITLPKAPAGYSYAFADCTALKLIDLGGSGGAVGTGTFRACPLQALVLRSTTMATLSNTNAFENSGIASGEGYIYVPRDLISTYESATNWATYAGQFRAIEDYTSDGTVDGEFIMPT